MSKTIALNATVPNEVIEKLSQTVFSFAKKVTVSVFVAKKDAKDETLHLTMEVLGKTIPVDLRFEYDEEKEVGTFKESIDYPNVHLVVKDNHEAFEYLKEKVEEISTFGRLDIEEGYLTLKLILNSEDGFKFFEELSQKYRDLLFVILQDS